MITIKKKCDNCRFWTMYIDNGYCNIYDKQCEIDDGCTKHEPNLSRSWEIFILTLGKSLGLYKILDWLNNKLSKSEEVEFQMVPEEDKYPYDPYYENES